MTRIIKSTMIVLLFLCCSFSFAQEKDAIEDLTRRVKVLEAQKENIDKQSQNAIENLGQKIDMKSEKIYWIIGILSFLGAGSIFGLYRHFKKRVKEIGEEQLEKKFEHFFEEKKKIIEDMIEKHSEETQLKKNKTILVISKDDDSASFVRKFFEEMNFSKVTYEKIDKVTHLKKADLVLFNDEHRNLNHDDILKIVRKTADNVVCFYFGPDRFDFQECRKRCNFANSGLQLYGNLMNTLRYQTLL